MDESRTTAAVQEYLRDLAGANGHSQAEPIVRDLLGRAVGRLHVLCARMLHQSYPRLTQGPLNLCTEEVLSAVVERLLKAMRDVRPGTVRQFFGLASQHMRWELNDLARRLDKAPVAAELADSRVVAPPPDDTTGSSPPSTSLALILAAIEDLPEEEREVFNLVRVQGLTQPEAAQVIGVSPKTVHRRLNRSLALLADRLVGLGPPPAPGSA